MGWILVAAALALVGLAVYVRLAPVNVDHWHVDMAAPDFEAPGNSQVYSIRLEQIDGPLRNNPLALLQKLDAIVLATPRSRRLAGSAAEGRITWETRSAIMGFPDYTTAQIMPRGALYILGRQRFGRKDFGVNAARIGAWAQELLDLPAPPKMTGPIRRFLDGE